MTTWTKVTGDFDFLNGYFDVRHRTLKQAFAGCDEWLEYDGTTTAHTYFDGAISIDEMRFPTKGSYGLSVRLFDPVAQGVEHLVDRQHARCSCTRRCAAAGRRTARRCRLVGDDELDGKPILCSYEWSDITADDRALGAGVLQRRRRDLGDQLDHGLHPPRHAATCSRHPEGDRRLRLPRRPLGHAQPAPQARAGRAGRVVRDAVGDGGHDVLRRRDQLRRGLVPDRRLPRRDPAHLQPASEDLVHPLDQQPPRPTGDPGHRLLRRRRHRASSKARTSGTASRSTSASSGPQASTRPPGSSPSPPTAAKPGSPTGK